MIFIFTERLNADVCRIHRWSLKNGLIFNAGKTPALIIWRDESRLAHPLPVLSLDREVILYSRNGKNLGMIMDERFLWCNQAKVVSRNVGFVLSSRGGLAI
jgi:hypothetical protein